MTKKPIQLIPVVLSAAILAGCGSSAGSRSNDGPTFPSPSVPGNGSGNGDGSGGDTGGGNTGGGTPPTEPSTSRNGYERTGVRAAQAQGHTGSSVKVGVIDSGFEKQAQVSAINVVHHKRYGFKIGETALPDGTYPLIQDGTHGTHGTGVASVLAGEHGVARNVSLYIGDVSAPDGSILASTIGTALTDLSAQGVKLFNISLGSLPYTGSTPSLPQQMLSAMSHTILNKDGLIIISAGNENEANPHISALAPLIDSKLQAGTIVVSAVSAAGIDPADFSDIADSSPYNKCGVAADWCLVAPDTYLTSQADGVSRYFTQTSAAAPLVTGIAALVAEKYPWASNDFLRHSLLTTATSLGDKAIYGWGMVNAEKAMHGPAALPFNDLILNVPGSSYTLGNDISGTYGLIKQGAGEIVLTGNNIFTGASTVDAGRYVVNGSVVNLTQVNPAGTVSGSGTFGAISNHGVVSVEDHDLTVNGNFQQHASGKLQLTFGNKLIVAGNADIAGTLGIAAAGRNYIAAGSAVSEKVLVSQSLSGRFDTTEISQLLLVDAKVKYTATDVEVSATRVNTSQAAGTLRTAGHFVSEQSASNLENLYQAIDADTGAIRSNDALIQLASQLQGTTSGSGLASTMNAMDANIYASNMANNRLQLSHGNKLISQNIGHTGAYASATGGKGHLSRSEQADWDAQTLLLGNNFNPQGPWQWGTGVLIQNAKVKQDSGKSKNTSTGVFGTAQYGRVADGYLRTILAAYHIDNRTQRSVSIEGEQHGISGHADGYLLNADFSAGKQFSLYRAGNDANERSLNLTPQLGVMFNHQQTKAFTENGADGLAYDFSRATRNSTTLHGGVDLAYKVGDAHQGTTLQAYVDVEHDVHNGNQHLTGRFANTGASVEIAYWNLPRTRYSAGLGAQYQFNDWLSLGMRYDRQFASKLEGNYFNFNLRARY